MLIASILSTSDPPSDRSPDFAASDVTFFARNRLDDSRHFDIACAAEFFEDDDIWVATCTAIERGCADFGVGDDRLAECLAVERCEDAKNLIVRSKCTDTERRYVLRFDDRDGRFIE
jgi:hypothetical protein